MDGDTGKRKDDYAHGMAQDRRQVTNHLVHAARAQTRAHCIRDRPRSDDVALAHAAQATHPHSRRCAVVCHSGPEDRARRAGRGQTRRHDRQAGHAPFFLRPVGGAVVVSHVCTAAIGGGHVRTLSVRQCPPTMQGEVLRWGRCARVACADRWPNARTAGRAGRVAQRQRWRHRTKD